MAAANRRVAHELDNERSKDVETTNVPTFEALLLSQRTLMGLQRSGFRTPSPIQARAIPMAKCGVDMIVQAKSGTGKTCVFAVVSLEMVNVQTSDVQVVILAPTREIALQICDNINCIGVEYPGLKCFAFIGGIALEQDKVKMKRCHIFVGTPGRTKQLIQVGLLKPKNVRLFVLDEADKLLETSFHEDINYIYSSLPLNKQMLALSATFPSQMVEQLSRYMRAPTIVRLNSDDPALLGIKQFYHSVSHHNIPHIVFQRKLKVLTQILVDVPYTQCLVFMNSQMRAEMLRDRLRESNFPCDLLSGAQKQSERIASLVHLKKNKCRILVTTDLAARGIDAEKVSLVVNFEVPSDKETYLHRIGRTGRYGSFGISISIATEGPDCDNLRKITKDSNVVLRFVGTLRDFRHILTVTNEPVDDSIINHVTYPPAPDGENRSASMTPASSNSSRASSRSSSRCPSRRSSLRRRQAVKAFITQSEPCTPLRKRSDSDSNCSDSESSLADLNLVERIKIALTPSCEDLHLRSIDEALESLAKVPTSGSHIPRLNGSLVWQPLMQPPNVVLSDHSGRILEEGSDDESDATTYKTIRPTRKLPQRSVSCVSSLQKTSLSQSLTCLSQFGGPSLSRQNSSNSFKIPGSLIGARWESQCCLTKMYSTYIKGMLNSRSDYFQATR